MANAAIARDVGLAPVRRLPAHPEARERRHHPRLPRRLDPDVLEQGLLAFVSVQTGEGARAPRPATCSPPSPRSSRSTASSATTASSSRSASATPPPSAPSSTSTSSASPRRLHPHHHRAEHGQGHGGPPPVHVTPTPTNFLPPGGHGRHNVAFGGCAYDRSSAIVERQMVVRSTTHEVDHEILGYDTQGGWRMVGAAVLVGSCGGNR
jgi:hypothetical protein